MLLYTSEHLIRYAYGECSPEESKAISAALEQNWELKEKLDFITGSMQLLEAMEPVSPRKKVIDFLLNYAKQTSAIEMS